MGNVSIKDVKTLKDDITASSKHGFLSFLCTMGQYASVIALSYMILNSTTILEQLNGNISSFVLAFIALILVTYFSSRYNSKIERKQIVDQYMKEQKAEEDIKKKKHEELVQYRVNIGPQVNNALKDLLIELGADRVCVCEMHNGTNNLSGLPFLYADMAYEVDGHDMDDVSDEFKNVNLSKYPIVGNHFSEGIFLASVDDISKEDPKFAMRLKVCDTDYFACMVISGVNNPLGFLTVSFSNKNSKPSKVQIIAAMNQAAQIISSLIDTPRM